MTPQEARERMQHRLAEWDDKLRRAFARGEIDIVAAVKLAVRIEDLRLSLVDLVYRDEPVERDPNQLSAKLQAAQRTAAEMSNLRAEVQGLRTQQDRMRSDWARIEKLVGREFTSPESVIDRVAWLVERQRELTDIAKDAHQKQELLTRQRDELMRAADDLCTACDAGNPGRRVAEMAGLLDRIRREIAGP